MNWIQTAAALSLSIFSTAASAQDISGTWQGMTRAQRVVKIVKAPLGGFRGEMFLLGDIESTLNGNPISTITVKNGTVHFQTDRRFGIFDGNLSTMGRP